MFVQAVKGVLAHNTASRHIETLDIMNYVILKFIDLFNFSRMAQLHVTNRYKDKLTYWLCLHRLLRRRAV